MFFALLFAVQCKGARKDTLLHTPFFKEGRLRGTENLDANIPPAVIAAAAVGAYVMDHVQVNVNVHFRAADLIDELEVMYGALGERKIVKKDVDGGIWISGTVGRVLFSAYYHPTKKHTVRVKAGENAKLLPAEEEWVEAGQWAIIYTATNEKSGNEAFYEVEDTEETNSPVPVIPAAQFAAKLFQHLLKENNAPESSSELPMQSLEEHMAESNSVKSHPIFAKDLPMKTLEEYTNEEQPEANIPPLVAAAAAWAVDWASDHVNINVDFRASDFIDTLEKKLGRNLGARRISKKQAEGGIWISGSAGDVIFSAYYHDTKRHTVAIKAGKKSATLTESPEWVEPGKWAVIYTITTTDKGNQAFFKVDDSETNAPKPWVVFDLEVTIPLSQWFGC